MMLVVNFVSLMVHCTPSVIWPDDPGYQRFFSYISLFTFLDADAGDVEQLRPAVLRPGKRWSGLVSADRFWYTRPTAIYANLKAFLVNGVGDFGFLLGIGLIAAYAG